MTRERRKARTTKRLGWRRIVAFLHGFLKGLSRPRLWLLICGLLSIIGVIDYVTGTEISVGFFYLAPVAIAAWYINRDAGMGVSLASAAIWFIVAGPAFPAQKFSFPVLLWNAGVHLGFFVVV